MRVLYRTLVLSTLVVAAAACGKKDNRDAFRGTDDLLLPSGGNAVASSTELGLRDSIPAAAAPLAQPARSPQRVASRSTTARRTSTSSGGSSSGVYTAPAPVRVKHTQRDAAVGAVAGAVLGATIDGSHRVRGAVVGGVVGGILGGVLGNNVDITKKK